MPLAVAYTRHATSCAPGSARKQFRVDTLEAFGGMRKGVVMGHVSTRGLAVGAPTCGFAPELLEGVCEGRELRLGSRVGGQSEPLLIS